MNQNREELGIIKEVSKGTVYEELVVSFHVY